MLGVNELKEIAIKCGTPSYIFDTDENKILGFFEIEGASELDRKGVTHALKDKVPQWMIPNVLVKVETMPITKNGKIDRKELMKIYKEQEA